jgi:hypothetical protein
MACTQEKIIYYKNWELVAEKFIYPANQISISGLKMAELQAKGIIQGKLPRPHGRGFGVSSGLHDAPSSPLRGVYVPPTRTSR